jgi:peroxiredoxin
LPAQSVQLVGLSADPPEVNKRFKEKLRLPFQILSDVDCRLVQALDVPVSKKHPMVKLRGYTHGFAQPAVFIFDARGEQQFSWIQRPKLTNAYGAARRMSPEEIVSKAREVAAT